MSGFVLFDLLAPATAAASLKSLDTSDLSTPFYFPNILHDNIDKNFARDKYGHARTR